MRRIRMLVSLVALTAVSACSDRPSTSPELPPLAPRLTETLPACPNLSPTQVESLILSVFEPGSPDANSALGKWQNIQKQVADGNLPDAKAKTFNLVDFMLEKERQGKLVLPDEDAVESFKTLVRALFCFVGVDAGFNGGDGWIVYPTDLERTLIATDGQAAMRLPPNAVNEPSVITIVPTEVDLNTNLDKYPVNYDFSKYPATAFAKAVTTEVCATAPDDVFPRLVLGHNKSDGTFELLAKVPAGILTQCVSAVADASPSVVDRLLAFVLPQYAYAAVLEGVGGVAGSVIELSPIGPVDPLINVIKGTAGTSAPIGSLVTPAPSVTLQTPNGTLLGGIGVNFTVGTGSDQGIIAPGSTNTANGTGIAAATSWRLGNTVGATYSASATPTIGSGDAVPGVIFAPGSHSWTATATGPTQVVITQSPNGQTFSAGATHTPATVVQVRDAAGRLVEGYAGTISLAALRGSTPATLGGVAAKAATAGQATFADLSLTKVGSYSITASGAFAGTPLSNTGASYTVTITPATASTLTIVSGNAQSALVGTTLGAAIGTTIPTVLVSDAYGNVVPGTTVYFAPSNNTATVTPVINPTNDAGNATATWTLQEGANEMVASLDATLVGPNAARFALFTATGTTSRATSAEIISCAIGNQRDRISDYAARMAGIGNKELTDVKFNFSINGSANQESIYLLRVTARVYASGVTDAAQPKAVYTSENTPVFLRGTSTDDKQANFSFPTPIVSLNTDRIVMTIDPVSGQDIRGEITVNVGSCQKSADGNCVKQQQCAVSEVARGTPLLAVFRPSFGVQIFGR